MAKSSFDINRYNDEEKMAERALNGDKRAIRELFVLRPEFFKEGTATKMIWKRISLQ